MSEVLYRKWRPRRLDELVGQEPVTQTLTRAVALGRVAHAYLFCGPRGTGKTSTARILAKSVNCLASKDGEADDSCGICRSINEGRALDLVEIDAASNRGIDDIRTLRDKVHFTPNEARYKVYIVDEVHMLSDAAFNALLKTLEEPPPRQIYILCTPSHASVLPTIQSRCQIVRFGALETSAIVDWLGAQGIAAERADLAATLGAGRPGLALRLAADEKAWDLRRRVLDAAARLSESDAYEAVMLGEVLEPSAKLSPDDKRTASTRTFEVLTLWFRDLVFLKQGVSEDRLVNRDHAEALHAAVHRYALDGLLKGIKALQDARAEVRQNVNNKLVYSRLMLALRAR